MIRFAICLVIAGPVTALAQEPKSPVIPVFERLAKTHPDRLGPHFLIGELNCIACHKVDAKISATVIPRKAPVLNDIGARADREWIRKFLNDPHATKPGTTMPAMFGGMSASERKSAVEALVHFLGSTGELRHTPPNAPNVASGEKLFHSVGCVACHNPRKNGAKKLATSVPLGKLEDKYSIPALSEFIKSPTHVRPSGRMPSLNLTDQEATDIASYLLKELNIPPNIKVAYYEGSFQKLPDFSKLKPKYAGGAIGFNVNSAKRRDQFALRFESYFVAKKDGKYGFRTTSDDGSKLYVDDKLVVNNDGVHGNKTVNGSVDLKAGVHKVVVEFFEQGGGENLQVSYSGPGFKNRQLQSDCISDPKHIANDKPKWKPIPALVEKGRKLFASIGCANCHDMKADGKNIVSTLQTTPFANLGAGKGCLSPAKTKTPFFALSQGQQANIKTALTAKPVAKADSPQATIHRALSSFNCYACHSRDKVGGVERDRNVLFQGAIPEMGDEGRIPPFLTGAGDKLKATWMKHILSNGANDRPYMLTRMPKFGIPNIDGLTKAFAHEAKTTAKIPKIKDLKKIRETGRHIVGAKALSCIKCHPWGKYKAVGLQSLNMIKMNDRLRRDWYHRYMKNPQAYRPGTRMPASWLPGIVALPDLLGGDADLQVAAIWEYLEIGPRAKLPEGIALGSLELLPISRPIIYRNFIQGVSPRGIGVGYPERLSIAWDADKLGPAMLWQGAFIDAKRHWTGRGQGFQPPAGTDVIKLATPVPFASLKSADDPWPTKPARETGWKFKGYRLDKEGRPTFLYSFGDISIEELWLPVEEKNPSFKRVIKVNGDIPANFYLHIASGSNITPSGKLHQVDDGGIKFSTGVPGGKGISVQKPKSGKQRIVWAVPNDQKTATISITYAWPVIGE